MRTRVSAAAVFGALAMITLAACGGGTEPTGNGGGTQSGDCKSDADCGGQSCVEVTAGGFKICLTPPPEATVCSAGGPTMDQCCSSSECQGGGRCYLSTAVPSCGGAAMAEYNYCAGDGCQDDSGCQGAGIAQICAPAGAFGQPGRACMNAYCRSDADCTKKAGGQCVPVSQPCCSVPAGLACVYPDGCRNDQDCGDSGSSHCEIDPETHDGACLPGPAACPA